VRAVKTHVQGTLKRLGLYDRLKASYLYDLYWLMVDRSIIDARRSELAFYRRLLRGMRPGDLVFDIGANEGYKTDIFLRMGARVVAVEPDKHCQEVLKRRFLQHRLRARRVVIVGAAVSDHDGVDTIWTDAPGSAKNTLSRKWVELLRNDDRRFGARLAFGNRQDIETLRIETLISRYGEPFFIKIDVEGYEPRVLRGLDRPVSYVSFEVNLPEFRLEGRQCIELLAAQSVNSRFNYAVDCHRGLVLQKWADRREFLSVFGECDERSIEVFWTRRG
jgi:FkbM family methyltransferase